MSRPQPAPSVHLLVSVEQRAPRFLRIADAANDCGMSKSHVRNLIKGGLVDAYDLDGVTLISVDSWDRYVSTAKPRKVAGD